jgi:hypothetical protein
VDARTDVTAADLYRSLKEAGTPNLVDPGSALTIQPNDPHPLDCDVNGARALEERCSNRIHWPGSHPVVYFMDHTGPQWPVYSAASVWNQSTAMDVGYRWYTNPCPSGASCSSKA